MELNVDNLRLDYDKLWKLLGEEFSARSSNTEELVPTQRALSESDDKESLKGGRVRCFKCGKSRKFWCSACCVPVVASESSSSMKSVDMSESSDMYPIIRSLPFTIHIVRHHAEVSNKSSAIPLKLICPAHVKLHTYNPRVPESLPINFLNSSSSPVHENHLEDSILLFPVDLHRRESCVNRNLGPSENTAHPKMVYEDSRLFRDFVLNNRKVTNVVILDCTWHQTHSMLRHETIRNLTRLEIDGYRSVFWRYNMNKTRFKEGLKRHSNVLLDSKACGKESIVSTSMQQHGSREEDSTSQLKKKIGLERSTGVGSTLIQRDDIDGCTVCSFGRHAREARDVSEVCSAECVYYILMEYHVATNIREYCMANLGKLPSLFIDSNEARGCGTWQANCDERLSTRVSEVYWRKASGELYHGQYDNILFFFVLIYKQIQKKWKQRPVPSLLSSLGPMRKTGDKYNYE
eukprot:GHVQ01036875.1.p1 GENE.GHVQ01036875.1~~GHVQ01036875.1.p1  ORF type:complete len:462 (+),score=24.67 GHVQ01036875.1:532-1917(+)